MRPRAGAALHLDRSLDGCRARCTGPVGHPQVVHGARRPIAPTRTLSAEALGVRGDTIIPVASVSAIVSCFFNVDLPFDLGVAATAGVAPTSTAAVIRVAVTAATAATAAAAVIRVARDSTIATPAATAARRRRIQNYRRRSRRCHGCCRRRPSTCCFHRRSRRCHWVLSPSRPGVVAATGPVVALGPVAVAVFIRGRRQSVRESSSRRASSSFSAIGGTPLASDPGSSPS